MLSEEETIGEGMQKIIKKLKEEKIITVYYEDMDEEYVCGFVRGVTETELVLACVDRYGENNGFLLLELEGIYRIDFESVYENKMEFLYEKKQQKHELINFEESGKSLRTTLLQWAYQNGKTVEMDFENCYPEACGYLEEESGHKIRMIDRYECKPGQGSA